MGEAGLDQQPRTSMTRPRSPRPGDGARATSLSVHRSEAVDAQRRLRHQVPWHPVLSRRAQKGASMLSKPLAYASTLDRPVRGLRDRIRTSFVEAFWSPALAYVSKKRRQKQPLFQQRHLLRRNARGPFSLKRGLKSSWCFSSCASPLVVFSASWIRLRNDEGDPLGSPSREAGMRLGS
jgi:hypothetical protein